MLKALALFLALVLISPAHISASPKSVFQPDLIFVADSPPVCQNYLIDVRSEFFTGHPDAAACWQAEFYLKRLENWHGH